MITPVKVGIWYCMEEDYVDCPVSVEQLPLANYIYSDYPCSCMRPVIGCESDEGRRVFDWRDSIEGASRSVEYIRSVIDECVFPIELMHKMSNCL